MADLLNEITAALKIHTHLIRIKRFGFSELMAVNSTVIIVSTIILRWGGTR